MFVFQLQIKDIYWLTDDILGVFWFCNFLPNFFFIKGVPRGYGLSGGVPGCPEGVPWVFRTCSWFYRHPAYLAHLKASCSFTWFHSSNLILLKNENAVVKTAHKYEKKKPFHAKVKFIPFASGYFSKKRFLKAVKSFSNQCLTIKTPKCWNVVYSYGYVKQFAAFYSRCKIAAFWSWSMYRKYNFKIIFGLKCDTAVLTVTFHFPNPLFFAFLVLFFFSLLLGLY